MNGNFISFTRPNVRVAPEKVSIDYQNRSYSFPQRLQRLIKAVVVEPVKRKTSEFIWFKLTSNRDFNGENFFSLSEAFPYGLFRSTTKLTSLLLINIWFASTFTQHLDSPPSNSINFFSLFISLQCCYNIDIVLRYYFLFLEGRGGD